MKKEITFRQIGSIYIFISLSTIFKKIPRVLASGNGNEYVNIIYSAIIVLSLFMVIIFTSKIYPGLNIYEITKKVYGQVLAKVIMILYLVWLLLLVSTKAHSYSMTLSQTLMPKTNKNLFFTIMIFMVVYALQSGIKTIFRISEFCLSMVLLFIAVIILFSIPNIRLELLTFSGGFALNPDLNTVSHLLSIGGNIILLLFFADRLETTLSNQYIKKLLAYVGKLFLVILLITIVSIGVCGAEFIKRSSFPFYIAVKSISIFSMFERLEVIITLISVLSDFIGICIYFAMAMQCLRWIFNKNGFRYLYLFLIAIIYCLTFIIGRTEFIFMRFYQETLLKTNIVFAYIIPFFIFIGAISQKSKMKEQL